MKVSKLVWVMLLGIVMIVVAACGGSSDDSSSDDTSTGPETSSVPELSETVSGSDDFTGTVTVNYPSGWAAEAVGADIALADSQATLEIEGDTDIAPGQFRVQVQAIPDEFLGALELSADSGAVDVLNAFSTALTGDETVDANFGDVENFTANGRDGAVLAGSVTEDEQTADVMLVTTRAEGGFVILLLAAAPGEGAALTETLQAMAGEVTFEAVESE